MFYDTDVQAQGGGLDSVLCREDNILLGPSTVNIERADVAAIMRSGVLSLSLFLSLDLNLPLCPPLAVSFTKLVFLLQISVSVDQYR